MKAEELRKKKLTDLEEELLKLRREQFNLNMRQQLGKMSNVHLLKKARRSIARVKTVIHEQRLSKDGK